MSKRTKQLLWTCLDIMTKELEDQYKEEARNVVRNGPSIVINNYIPRPMSERMNLINTLLKIQSIIENRSPSC